MLQVIEHDSIVELNMNRPPANALITPMVVQLLDAVRAAQRQGADGIVLSGREGMFSGGLDVPALLGEPRPAIYEFWSSFMALNRALASSSVPVVAAITGHAPAGGAVMAIHCDYRIGAQGRFKIGFNEVQVGLPVPVTILQAFARCVGARRAATLATAGALIPVQDAAEIGLIDELVAPERVCESALEHLRGLAALPPIAMNRTRLAAKADFLAALRDSDDVDTVTGDWFSDETQREMGRLADSLRK